MKFTKLALAALMATSMAACSADSTSSTASTSASASASSSASSAEEIATEGKYTVQNISGETVTELYFYQTGSEDKGENYAEAGLADQDTVVVEISVDEAEAEGYEMTVEFATESGSVVAFETLHLEEANMYLKPVDDVTSGATPFINAE